MLLRDLAAGGQTNCEVDLSRDTSVSCTYDDWFGCNWTWVPSAGGPMLTPGTQRLDDITKWEKEIKFPELSDFDWGRAKCVSEKQIQSGKSPAPQHRPELYGTPCGDLGRL